MVHSTCAMRSLVVVLPEEPVTPTIWVARPCPCRVSPSSSATYRARRPNAATTSSSPPSTSRGGASTGRETRTAAAPESIAWAAKSCPSTRSPFSATNKAPGAACLESMTTGPSTTVSGHADPPIAVWVISAIRSSVSAIKSTPHVRPGPRHHRKGGHPVGVRSGDGAADRRALDTAPGFTTVSAYAASVSGTCRAAIAGPTLEHVGPSGVPTGPVSRNVLHFVIVDAFGDHILCSVAVSACVGRGTGPAPHARTEAARVCREVTLGRGSDGRSATPLPDVHSCSTANDPLSRIAAPHGLRRVGHRP